MMRSKKLNNVFLYLSYAGYMAFAALWAYTSLWLSRKHPNWEQTHTPIIYVATATSVFAGCCWVVAVWPVFHLWTIPLGFVGLFGFLSLVNLIPRRKAKKE